jgi:hypothetical protein
MHKKEMYRLGEYLITVSDNGQIEWQAHAPLAMERRGNCFILGNILILGQCRDEDHGYLKMEFHDHLRKLPQWTKTDFYCSSVNLLDIITSQVAKEEFLQQMSMLARIKGATVDSTTIVKRGAFRLGRYIINVAHNGQISWQTIQGLNKVIGGQCRIESNVLFICPQEYVQEHQNKQNFFNKMNRLPRWNNTIAWCKSMVLEECQPRQAPRQYRAIANTEDLRLKFIRGRNFFENYRARSQRKPFKIPFSSAYKLSSTLLPLIRRAKALFKRLIPAVLGASVLLVGLILIFYAVGKGCHHRDDDHHYKHEHEED